MYGYNVNDFYGVTAKSGNAWLTIAAILAIVGGFVVYFLFMSSKNEKKFTGFTKWLYDFLNFKNLTLELILKVCYVILAIYTTLSAFNYIATSALEFFGILIIGNLLLRVAFEAALLVIMIYKNTKEINEKTK